MKARQFNDHIPRKRFGQHFLIDPQIIHDILQAAHLKLNDHVLEIGPGLGALTEQLLEKTQRLDCVEIDRDLSEKLKARFGSHPHFFLHQADALKFDLMSLKSNHTSLRVIGNLPYNITTPLLFRLLHFSDLIQDMHFMLQKEVVDRITAVPGTKSFGRLTLMIQYFCKAEALFSVPPQAFSPPPKVYSSVLRLIPYEKIPYSVQDFSLFEAVTQSAFSQRRKMLSNSLKSYITEKELEALKFDPKIRPDVLSLPEWVRLCNAITKRSST